MWRSWPWLWISIHAPAKGATICARQQDVNKNHFNPRSREGSDRCRSWWFERKEQFQSTLPRRERRRKPKQGTNHVNISIHAPAKGATIYGKWGRVDLADFNPRSREGSDCPLDGPTLVGQISIHAPAKGATSTVPDDYPQYCVFQSTLPRRERLLILLHIPKINKFQSTLPRRERL